MNTTKKHIAVFALTMALFIGTSSLAHADVLPEGKFREVNYCVRVINVSKYADTTVVGLSTSVMGGGSVLLDVMETPSHCLVKGYKYNQSPRLYVITDPDWSISDYQLASQKSNGLPYEISKDDIETIDEFVTDSGARAISKELVVGTGYQTGVSGSPITKYTNYRLVKSNGQFKLVLATRSETNRCLKSLATCR